MSDTKDKTFNSVLINCRTIPPEIYNTSNCCLRIVIYLHTASVQRKCSTYDFSGIYDRPGNHACNPTTSDSVVFSLERRTSLNITIYNPRPFNIAMEISVVSA